MRIPFLYRIVFINNPHVPYVDINNFLYKKHIFFLLVMDPESDLFSFILYYKRNMDNSSDVCKAWEYFDNKTTN